ncbi:MAG: hypothetical protein DME33_06055 [Verrucomicrobia bacterium]|nr:MAG: hypothetical protein DME33_06055 [Verrucomicrobiota bacterium]
MDRVIISDPSDIFFPLPREVFEQSCLVYHGTGAINAQGIETNGWGTGDLPYAWNDVLKVLKWCEQLRLEFSDTEGGYSVLRAFSAGVTDAYVAAKPLSFSICYWNARNYAGNPDGETVTALRIVLSKLKAMASDLEERALHERALRHAMERSPLTYGETLREPVERLEAGFLEKHLPEITHLIEKHAHRVANFPVVLAVRLAERQVEPERRSLLALDCSTRIRFGGVEVRTLPEVIVHPDQLVACIEFPRGVRRWTSFAGRAATTSLEPRDSPT